MKPFQPTNRLGSHVQVVRFTSDGRFCLTGERQSVKLWNPFKVSSSSNSGGSSSNESEALLIQSYSLGITYSVTSLTTTTPSSDNSAHSWLLASSNKTVIVTDMITTQVVRKLQGQVGRINVVESANYGQAFLTGSYDGSVYLWDARALNNHKPVQILHEAKDSVMDVLLEPQHIVRTGSVDGVLRSYDFRKGFLTNDWMGAPIASMACTKNGEPCLAVSCLEDSTVRLMDVSSGELVNTYSGNHVATQYKIDVDVLADDSCVVTGSENGNCVLYDLVRASTVQVLDGAVSKEESINNPMCSIAAHPKLASCLVTARFDGPVTVWSNEFAVPDS